MSAAMYSPATVNAGEMTRVERFLPLVVRAQAEANRVFSTNRLLLQVILWYDVYDVRKLLGELRGVYRELEDLPNLISELPIRDDEARAVLREWAARFGEFTAKWDKLHHQWVSQMKRSPFIRQAVASQLENQLEDLACMTENIAETLALAASEPFAQWVRDEISPYLPEPIKQNGTS